MDKQLLDKQQAAALLGITTERLLRQCKAGTGPRFMRPSAHTMLFAERDLLAWKAAWKVVQPKTEN